MATLHVKFFDDLRGTTPKITTFPTHTSTETPDRVKEEELETLEEVRIPTHSTLIFKGLSTNSYIKNISQKSLLFLTEIG